MLRLFLLFATSAFAATPDAEIRRVIDDQAAAWNRGDIDAFMKSYDASPETTYAGSTGVTKGYDKVLARYKAKYSSRAAMGKLTFTGVDVRLIHAGFATVTGQFQLERAKDAGGNASGWFTLVFQKTSKGWKIIHDHTS